ncbi:hypothetical protein [Paractinoplanes ovalisporus]|uniref:hypothetical protein n=1 Tax=Paractinoplanes ovalisporus TaxID=2810368 RepID=UPI001F1FF633|nr:hypothetical protein [Actinoplanes ovalisporus]
MLVPWLIRSGHTPEQAENWLAQFPDWSSAGTDVLNQFATSNAAKAQTGSPSWMHELAARTSIWAQFREKQNR